MTDLEHPDSWAARKSPLMCKLWYWWIIFNNPTFNGSLADEGMEAGFSRDWLWENWDQH